MKTAVVCAALLALAACSNPPSGEDVIAQATADGQIAFDVVKIDDAVLTTLLAQPPPAFHERFKKYLPPPDLKIAVGDTVSVVIWESAANGLFGSSLTELSFPPGALARLLTGQLLPPTGVASQPQGLAASPEILAQLFGGAAASGGAASGGAAAAAAQGLTQQSGTQSGSQATPTYSALGAGTAPAQGQPAGAQSARPERPAGAQIEALLGVAAQSGRSGTRIPDQQVGSDGGISIPYAGRIAVAGRTAVEVERTIEKVLGPKALDPQALVIIKQSAANSVSVAGEVIAGARIPLSLGGDRLLQVIAAAGGAKAPPHDTFVRLSRGDVTATLPLATLVAEPDQDIFAEPGDVLTLVRRRQTFSVFGATGRNAAITFNSDRLSLSEALAKAGGLLDERADPRAVFVFRYEPAQTVRALGQPLATSATSATTASGATSGETAAPHGLSPIVYRLDLAEAKSYLLARRFPVHDKDVIFVANAKIQPIYNVFQALSQVTGPIQTGLVACSYVKC
jgi:polysaccharide export outer membrane protein